MAAASALAIAAYLVELSSENSENDLTNLKLQKLLYFAQRVYLTGHGVPLFSDVIEAWPYGPVVPVVYDAYKSCGAFPITVFDVPVDGPSIDELDDVSREFVNGIWDEYGRYSASYLVTLTHKKNGPWDKVFYKPSSLKSIGLDLLRSGS